MLVYHLIPYSSVPDFRLSSYLPKIFTILLKCLKRLLHFRLLPLHPDRVFLTILLQATKAFLLFQQPLPYHLSQFLVYLVVKFQSLHL